MQDTNKGTIQGYNAQLAVTDDGLILSPMLVQDGNDRRQLRPMSKAAVAAALVVHQARCSGQCAAQGGCCITSSVRERAEVDHVYGCGRPACPCLTDWVGTLLFDAGYWTQALRRFARRGLAACQAELGFAAMVLNIGKLCRLNPSRRSAALAA